MGRAAATAASASNVRPARAGDGIEPLVGDEDRGCPQPAGRGSRPPSGPATRGRPDRATTRGGMSVPSMARRASATARSRTLPVRPVCMASSTIALDVGRPADRRRTARSRHPTWCGRRPGRSSTPRTRSRAPPPPPRDRGPRARPRRPERRRRIRPWWFASYASKAAAASASVSTKPATNPTASRDTNRRRGTRTAASGGARTSLMAAMARA